MRTGLHAQKKAVRATLPYEAPSVRPRLKLLVEQCASLHPSAQLQPDVHGHTEENGKSLPAVNMHTSIVSTFSDSAHWTHSSHKVVSRWLGVRVVFIEAVENTWLARVQVTGGERRFHVAQVTLVVQVRARAFTALFVQPRVTSVGWRWVSGVIHVRQERLVSEVSLAGLIFIVDVVRKIDFADIQSLIHGNASWGPGLLSATEVTQAGEVRLLDVIARSVEEEIVDAYNNQSDS